MLPFDDRYLETPFEWMEFSYIRYMESVDWDELRDQNLLTRYKEDKKRQIEEGLGPSIPQMRQNGWSDEQITEIMDALKEQAT